MTSAPPDLKSIFGQAAEIAAPADRAAYLDEACGDDAALRSQVESLLDAAEKAGSFMRGPAVAHSETELYPRVSEAPGTVIGPYKLLQQIGEGGMGVVFMAEQTHPLQRTVALKIIKPGMDTRQVIARFDAERQAVAMMDHPNIAKVLDAGTTGEGVRFQVSGVSEEQPASPLTPDTRHLTPNSGRPYFVMELVKGVPITKYCDEKQLPLRARLELFTQVCQAVQHAHQKGVIHRDIKPNNVLVAEYDDQPVPKVIDFGVAKATAQRLTERTMFTEFGQVLGTMEYMSPEQSKFNQLDVDTRSDIYSLGVLLYELLAGSTPFEGKRLHEAAFDEMLRIIREEEPPKPSTRLSSLSLRERAGVRADSHPLPLGEDRGEGVLDLASIAANRHTEPARLSKEVRGELDWIVMKALEKDRNRRYQTASGFAADIERHLHDEPVQACPPSAAYRFRKFARRNKVALFVTSAAIAVLLALVAGLAVSNRLIAAQREQAEAHRQRAEENLLRARVAVRDILFEAALGRGEWAQLPPSLREKFTEKTVSFYTSLLHEESASPSLQYETAVGYRSLAVLHISLHDYEQAEKFARQAIAILDRIAADDPEAIDHRHQQAYSYYILGSALAHGKRRTEAEAAYTRAAALYDKLVSLHPNVADYFHELGLVLSKSGRPDDAIAAYRRAAELRGDDPKVPFESDVYFNLAYALSDQGKLDEAIPAYRKAIELNSKSRVAHNNLAIALTKQGKWDEAVAVSSKMVELWPMDISAHRLLGYSLSGQGRVSEAIVAFRKAIELNPDDPLAYVDLAGALASQGKSDEAAAAYSKAVELRPNDANACNALAWLLATIPDPQLRDARRAVELAENAVELAPQDGNIWNTLGVAQYRAGEWQKMVDTLAKAMELRGGGDASDWFFLAMANWQLGNKDDARSWFDKAVEWTEKNAPANEELRRFRAEAAQLLGVPEPQSSTDLQRTEDEAANTNNATPALPSTTDN